MKMGCGGTLRESMVPTFNYTPPPPGAPPLPPRHSAAAKASEEHTKEEEKEKEASVSLWTEPEIGGTEAHLRH